MPVPPTKPPMRRRKLPQQPPPPAPDVAPEPPAEEEAPPSLKISGTEPDPNAVEDEERNPDGTFRGNNKAAQTPQANAKRKQSLQVSHAMRKMLAMTPQQFEVAMQRPESVADQVAAQLLHSARNGVMDAIKTVYDRTEGRVPQALEVNNNSHKDVNERVSDIARERLNGLAIAASGAVPQGDDDVDVSTDGPGGAEEAGGEPGVAGESA